MIACSGVREGLGGGGGRGELGVGVDGRRESIF